jgi:hypothetical protein
MEPRTSTTYPSANPRAIKDEITSGDPGTRARMANLVLGVWLFISAFLWEHSNPSRTNTWILGAIIALLSLSAVRTPSARFGNTAAAVYLFISTLAITHSSRGTVWNNILVAIAVFVLSLVPSRGERHARA